MDKKESNIFRKSSLERIASPEQLTEYLHVNNPSAWLILGAVIIVLIGFLVWASLGSLETTIPATISVTNGEALAIVPGDSARKVQDGMIIRYDGKQTYLVNVEIQMGIAVADIGSSDTLADGEYPAEVVVERIHPISFLIN